MTTLRRLKGAQVFAPICLLLLLPACADKPPAPIEDRARGGTARPEQRYTVLRGDTLFSIAFRYGLDYRRLAAANAIAAPYTIFPGQSLALREAAPPPPAAKGASTSARTPGAAVAKSVRPPASDTPTSPKPEPAKPAPAKPSKKTSVTESAPAPPAPATRSTTPANAPVSRWTWPASGRVIRGFDANLHKGINIDGKRGEPVKAAAGGRVVYAGSGIAGYGLLLIVRHNDEFLSAYGHNDEVLVAEGAVVRAGQTVARFGDSGTDTVKLHFEIRQAGRPVDPRRLLPAR